MTGLSPGMPIALAMRRVLPAVVSALALSWLTPTPVRAESVDVAARIAQDEAIFVALINAERAKGGLPPLTVSTELVNVGRNWSTQLLTKSAGADPCQLSHNPSIATQVTADWRRLGENVGCGDVDAEFLHRKFVASPPHFKNIMDPTFDAIGVGIVYDGDVMFVTEDFMDLRDGTTTTATPTVLAMPGGIRPVPIAAAPSTTRPASATAKRSSVKGRVVTTKRRTTKRTH